MQPPKYSIAQVIDQLNIGGAEQILVMLASLLHKHGHKVLVVTTVAPGPLANKLPEGIQLINLHRKWKWNPVTMYRLVKALRPFDVVHVHSSYNLRYVFLASRLFALHKKIFYHEHYGNAVSTTPGILQRYIYKQTIFIAVSGTLATWAKAAIGLSPQQVFVLPNTIIKNHDHLRHQEDNNLCLCTVGNILPNKNALFALEVLQTLHQQGRRDATLTIIGATSGITYYRKLLFFINEKGLQQNVFFIPDCQDVQSILHRFTLAIHTALSESGPLVLIEYLAQGIPFIAYNTGEVAAQLQSHLPAFIMQDFDIDRWLTAIKYILSLTREETSRQLQQLYQQYFSPEEFHNRCIAIYKAGLAGNVDSLSPKPAYGL